MTDPVDLIVAEIEDYLIPLPDVQGIKGPFSDVPGTYALAVMFPWRDNKPTFQVLVFNSEDKALTAKQYLKKALGLYWAYSISEQGKAINDAMEGGLATLQAELSRLVGKRKH